MLQKDYQLLVSDGQVLGPVLVRGHRIPAAEGRLNPDIFDEPLQFLPQFSKGLQI